MLGQGGWRPVSPRSPQTFRLVWVAAGAEPSPPGVAEGAVCIACCSALLQQGKAMLSHVSWLR